jgi:putative transcriptional regulator
MATKIERSRRREAIVEIADDMHRLGIIGDAKHRKIGMRDVDAAGAPVAEPLSGADIRGMRERAHLSQAVFARTLNLSVGYVSQLERGAKRPSGPEVVLLDVIRRKGLEAIL